MQAHVRARTRPQRNNPKEEVMQSTYPFGRTNETSASTSKKEEDGYLLSRGEFASIDFPALVSSVPGQMQCRGSHEVPNYINQRSDCEIQAAAGMETFISGVVAQAAQIPCQSCCCCRQDGVFPLLILLDSDFSW